MVSVPVIVSTHKAQGGPISNVPSSSMNAPNSLMAPIKWLAGFVIKGANLATRFNPLNQNMFLDGFPYSYDKDSTLGWVIRDKDGHVVLMPHARRDMFEREAKTLSEALNMYNRARILDGRNT